MTLQSAWKTSMSKIGGPVAKRAAVLRVEATRSLGKCQVFDLIGTLGSKDIKRLAVLLHNHLQVPVSVIVRAHAGADAVRGYCDAGTMFNREVVHG